MANIILFGGSFDPIHTGHTLVAQDAQQQLQAEQLIFIPTKQSPLKPNSPLADDHHRLAMIQHAINGIKGFSVNDCEFNRPAPSYTLDTVNQIKQNTPTHTELFWLIGADTLKDLPHWYRIEDLMDRCHLTMMTRAGYPAPDFSSFETLWGHKRVEQLQKHRVETRMIDISSSEIRHRLQQQQDVSDVLAPQVLNYIQQHQLYQ